MQIWRPQHLSGRLKWWTTFFTRFGEFKANMEYRNVDFNADKTKQYEAVRKAMARKYSSGDIDLFGFIASAINRAGSPHVIPG